jgi:hypothetical protein
MNFDFLRKLFKHNQTRDYDTPGLLGANETEEKLVRDFVKLSPVDRMRNIIRYGESGKEEYFYLLKWAIFYDVDKGIKFAALKRMHLFKNNSDVVKALGELSTHAEVVDLEPYYSMALSRAGMISESVFKERMNNFN